MLSAWTSWDDFLGYDFVTMLCPLQIFRSQNLEFLLHCCLKSFIELANERSFSILFQIWDFGTGEKIKDVPQDQTFGSLVGWPLKQDLILWFLQRHHDNALGMNYFPSRSVKWPESFHGQVDKFRMRTIPAMADILFEYIYWFWDDYYIRLSNLKICKMKIVILRRNTL